MFDNVKLWIKITISMTISILIVGGILTFTNLHNIKETILLAEKNELKGYVDNISNGIAAETRLGEALSALVANMPKVQQDFANENRQALSDLLLPTFPVLSSIYGVRQFQFHKPPAMSFLRIHKPEKFGDDLSSFRHTVVHTNETKKATKGLESGVAGLGARGMVPVFLGKQHLGSVEFGMSFGQPFFDNFKKKYAVDVNLHIFRDNKFTTFASTLSKQPILSDAVLKLALKGDTQVVYKKIAQVNYAVSASAIQDYSGKPIGVIEVAMDRKHYLNSITQFKQSAIIIGFFSIFLGILISLVIARNLVKRINRVIHSVEDIAQGDLTVSIADQSHDEVGQLAHAASRMQKQLHDIAKKVLDNASQVYDASQKIANQVNGQAATSSELNTSVTEITTTMEELSASSSQISEHANSVVNIANHTLNSSKHGAEAVSGVKQQMYDIHEDNQSSLKEIVELGSKSKEISKIMDIINALADQTKLIAFNAALEASSAGESGKRFSVVASEIRRLADSVTESTAEIEARINEIQESISRLVINSEKGVNGINQGMHASETTAQTLSELVNTADETLTAAQQISLSTQQQKTASDQVVIALREIVTASSNTKDAITHISSVSNHMTELSAELKAVVNQFKVSSK